jgi:hypothetical protein
MTTMNTYFLHDQEGILVGWIEAADEHSAQEFAELHHDENVTISSRPEGEWYIRREVPQEVPELAFAA